MKTYHFFFLNPVRVLVACLVLVSTFVGASAQAKLELGAVSKLIKDGKTSQIIKAIEAGELSNEAVLPEGYSLLSAAAKEGNLELLMGLLELGAPAPAVDKFGRKAISYAVEKGNEEILKELSSRSSDLNFQDENGDTLMHLAVAKKDLKIFEHLRMFGVPLELENKKGMRPLMVAIEQGHVGSLRAVLSAGADLRQPTVAGLTPFSQAVKMGKAGLPLLIIMGEAGLDLNENDEKGRTIFHHMANFEGAKKSDYEKWVSQLISLGANLNNADGAGITPLKMAKDASNKALAEVLEYYGALLEDGPLKGPVVKDKDPRKEDLAHAEPEKEDEATKPDFAQNEKTEIGLSDPPMSPSAALLLAARIGDLESLKEVLKEKVDLELMDGGGFVPLHFMAMNGSPRGVEVLLKAGAKVEVKGGKLEETALHLAARSGNLETVELLIKAKAKLNEMTSKGLTPLDYAMSEENSEIIAFLKSKGGRSGVKGN